MVPVCFDAAAIGIIARRLAEQSDAALRLEIHHTYSRAGRYSIVRVRWTTIESGRRAAGFVRWQCPDGVPVFIAGRVLRYLEWHPLRVNGKRFGPFLWLSPVAGPYDVEQMLAWEQLHPTVGPHETLAA